MELDVNTVVTGSDLALILGITYQRVHQLKTDGILSTVSRGKYNLASSIQAYANYKGRKKPLSHAEQEKLNADVLIKKARATVLALEAKEMQNKMHHAEDVEALTTDLIYTIRSSLIALPGRLANGVVEAKTAAEAAEIIRAEVYRAMESIANYKFDSKKYEERVREQKDWDARQGYDDDY